MLPTSEDVIAALERAEARIAERLEREVIGPLRAEVLALKQKLESAMLDAATQRHLRAGMGAEVLALKQERDELRKSLDRTIDREDALRRELTSARESERRLRERVKLLARRLRSAFGPVNAPAVIDAIEALTDDPPGQAPGR